MWIPRVLSLAITFASLLTIPSSAQAQAATVSGTLRVMIVDAADNQFVGDRTVYSLLLDDGREMRLAVNSALAQSLGGPARLGGSRVTVDVADLQGLQAQAGVPAASRVRSMQVLQGPALQQVQGTESWAVVGCAFSDVATTPNAPSWWTTMMGSSFPGADDYFRTVSYGNYSVNATATNWYSLPSPASAYRFANGTSDASKLLSDCVAAADPAVYFPGFTGIVFHANGALYSGGNTSYAFVGTIPLTSDNGTTKQYRVAVITGSHYDMQGVWTHEIGHTLGLQHSAGSPLGNNYPYDSKWDVMSGGAFYLSASQPFVGTHPTAYQKNILSWIPTGRVYTLGAGLTRQVLIEDQASPPVNNNFLLARVPINGSTSDYYAVELRRQAAQGYDRVPGSGIVIHRVYSSIQVTPGGNGYLGTVIDADGNGNVNDAGAVWTVGEVFQDQANGVSISVDQAIGSGFLVTLSASGSYNLDVSGATGATGRGQVASSPGGIGCVLDASTRSGNCNTAFATGTTVTLSATPDPGNRFVRWGGDCAGASCSVQMTRARAVTAEFEKQCTLTLQQGANGTIALTSGTATGACGRSVTVAATPSANYTLSAWSDGTAGTVNPYVFTLSSDKTLSAAFTASSCTLTLQQGANGTIALTSGTATGACGRSVTVTATPSANYSVSAWSDGTAGSVNPYTFTLISDKTLSATFSASPCTLTLQQGANGTIALTSGTATGACGRPVTVTATPSANFSLSGWSDGTAGTVNPYAFTLSSNKTLSASFSSSNQCVVTLQVVGGTGTASATSGGLTGICGRAVTVGAIAATGFRFAWWTDGGNVVSVDPQYSFAASVPRILTAVFSPTTSTKFRISSLAYDDTVNIDAAVNSEMGSGWKVADWSDVVTATGSSSATNWANSIGLQDLESVYLKYGGLRYQPGTTWHYFLQRFNSRTPYSGFLVVDQLDSKLLVVGRWNGLHMRVLAVQATPTCTLTLQQGANGTIALSSGTATGACGRSVTVTATPGANHSLSAWSDGTAGSLNPYTFTLNSDKTLGATFTANSCTLTLQQGANGTIALTSGTATGACGRSVTVAATPSANYSLGAWSDGTSGSVNPYAFSLNGDKTLGATFTANTCTLTLQQAGNGTIALTSGTATGMCGRPVTVTATPSANYSLSAWSDGTAGSVNPYTFTLNSGKNLSAVFVQSTSRIQLNINATTPLTVSPNGVADIPIVLDFSQIQPGTNLASISFQLTWNPAHFAYASHSVAAGTFGNPIVNSSNAGAGSISVALFAPTATTSTFTVLRLSLRAAGTPVAQSMVGGSISAAGNDIGQSILPVLQVRPLAACIGSRAGLRGDSDGDGAVTIIDAQQIARFVVGLPVLNPQQLAAGGDANGDGTIDIIDAQQVARSVIGLSSNPNIGQPLPGGCP